MLMPITCELAYLASGMWLVGANKDKEILFSLMSRQLISKTIEFIVQLKCGLSSPSFSQLSKSVSGPITKPRLSSRRSGLSLSSQNDNSPSSRTIHHSALCPALKRETESSSHSVLLGIQPTEMSCITESLQDVSA